MITARFPGRYDSLSAINGFYSSAVNEAGFDQDASYAILMAVDEACSNIIDHAYGGENIGEIICSYELTPDEILIVLQDFGQPFDPADVPPPDLESALESRPERGLGLYFMRKLMDCVTFRFSPEQGNILTMTKRKENRS
ncbi:MAG: ATP-binding protein [Anaerolineaceae bacterium]